MTLGNHLSSPKQYTVLAGELRSQLTWQRIKEFAVWNISMPDIKREKNGLSSIQIHVYKNICSLLVKWT